MDEFCCRRCPPGTIPYAIRAGDTLYRIGVRFNSSVPAIISANPGIAPNFLRIGQVICVPLQPVYPACPEGNYYNIRPGDTLNEIAQRFNVSLDDLIEANPGIDPNALNIGQVICVPLATPPVTCPPGFITYIIRPGDNFYRIAQRFNIAVADIVRANPTLNPNALLVGQRICVPRR